MTAAPARILIVEDERVVARELERRLARFGYEVVRVTAFGEQAVLIAEAERPDLVLMDIRLKGELDGIGAAERIRAGHIPVVFLTAYADDATLQAARVTEPYGYILKPFEERELRIVIEMAIYRHAAERERARLDEQARRSQKLEAIGQLAGGIAHDFSNVLMVILNMSHLLLHQGGLDETSRDRIGLIQAAAERAARMTRQLLLFGRDDLLAPVLVDLGGLIRGLGAMLSQLVGEHVTLALTIGPDLDAVRAAPGNLEQLVLNLVLNARDAMPAGGVVSIVLERAERPGDHRPHLRLTVVDTGTGMDEAMCARIFEPFYTTKAIGEGTGLGLTTVYAVVEKAGGTIEVASAIGHGTTFTIWLPAAGGAAEQRGPAADAPPQIGGTVMVVEDDAVVRQFLHDILREAGATVLEAQDGVDALQVSRAYDGPIDVVLSDVVMPRMSGFQLSDQLAIDRPGTRFIHMSGYPDRSMPGGCRDDLGPVRLKPFTTTQLLEWIRATMDS